MVRSEHSLDGHTVDGLSIALTFRQAVVISDLIDSRQQGDMGPVLTLVSRFLEQLTLDALSEEISVGEGSAGDIWDRIEQIRPISAATDQRKKRD
jgi:hypothetical protein